MDFTTFDNNALILTGNHYYIFFQTRKAAFISGAARGIGFPFAKNFLAGNYLVAIMAIDGVTLSRTMEAFMRPG